MNFENNINFSEDYVSVLEIENKQLFSSVILSLMCDNDEEQKESFVLTDGEKELKTATHLLMVTDIIGFDINNKKILSLAIERLEKICQCDETILHEIEEANAILATRVISLINELNSDFTISAQWNLSKYLKAFDFEADKASAKSNFDKIIQYLQIVADLLKDHIICFVNLKSFFTDEQIQEIFKFGVYNKVKLFLLESVLSDTKFEYEHKLIIDKEFDEFIKI